MSERARGREGGEGADGNPEGNAATVYTVVCLQREIQSREGTRGSTRDRAGKGGARGCAKGSKRTFDASTRRRASAESVAMRSEECDRCAGRTEPRGGPKRRGANISTLTRWLACRRILLPVGGRSALAGSQKKTAVRAASRKRKVKPLRRPTYGALRPPLAVATSRKARRRALASVPTPVRRVESLARHASRIRYRLPRLRCVRERASSRDARAAVRRLSRFTRGAPEVPFLSSAHRASAFCPPGAFPRPSLSPL